MRPIIVLLLASRAIAAEGGDGTPIPAAWRDAVAAAAQSYHGYDRIGDGLAIAPTRCERPEVAATLSAADDGTPHARKIYRLYVAEPGPYLASRDRDQPLGQVVVKDAFHPQIVADATGSLDQFRERPVPADGRWLAAGERYGLFLMLKVGDAAAAGTDAGWIYATTSADGATVTACGRLATCMSCHQDAPRDRLFGVKAPPAR